MTNLFPTTSFDLSLYPLKFSNNDTIFNKISHFHTYTEHVTKADSII